MKVQEQQMEVEAGDVCVSAAVLIVWMDNIDEGCCTAASLAISPVHIAPR